MVSFTPQLAAEYEGLWATCEIDFEPQVATATARRLLKNKARYQQVERATGVPWFWIAIVHEREASGSFLGILHNGEKIIGTGRKTRLVPSGRGPFTTWEEAAVDALNLKGLNKSVKWDVGRFWYECERFNGFGYRSKGVPSPYLWSHTNHYKDFAGDNDPGGGKYVADHVYDPNVHDKQLGAAAVLKALMALDKTISVGPAANRDSGRTEGAPAVPPALAQTQGLATTAPSSKASVSHPAGLSGVAGVLLAVLAWLGAHWYVPVGLAIVLVLGYWLLHKSTSKVSPKGEAPKAVADTPEPTKEPVLQETPNSQASSDPVKDEKSPTVLEQKPTSE